MTDKTKITKEQLNLFIVCGKHFIMNVDSENNPLVPAIEAILPEATEKLKKVERQKNLFRISLAKKTASKHLEVDKHGNHMYTEEDTKKIWDKMDEIDKEEVNLTCNVIKDHPSEGLSYDIKMAFSGIVIPKINIPKFEEDEEEKEVENDD